MNARLIWAIILVVSTTLGGALADTAEGHGRLVVADGKQGLLSVIDLETGTVVGRFTTPGPASVYPAPGRQYAFAIHREQDRVSILYSGLGLEDHGDHKDLVLQNPYIWATLHTGPKPTHFKSHGDSIVIYNDGDGTMAVFDSQKLGLVPDFVEIATGAPDHGAPVAFNGQVLAGSLNRGVVDLFQLDGKKLASFPGCPRLHGQAVLGTTVAYGCSDGVLLLEQKADGFVPRKLTNPPGASPQTRVGTLVAHPSFPAFIGNFGQGLARIGQEILPIPLLANPVSFNFDKDGQLVVLTSDGRLHTLEIATGRVKASLAVTGPIVRSGEGAVVPTLALGDHTAYLTEPATGQVLEIDLSEMKITRKFNVGGTPASVAWLYVEGARH